MRIDVENSFASLKEISNKNINVFYTFCKQNKNQALYVLYMHIDRENSFAILKKMSYKNINIF